MHMTLQEGVFYNDTQDPSAIDYNEPDGLFSVERQQKFLREKLGGVNDDEDEEDEKKQKLWSRGKSVYYGSDDDFELQSSGEDTPVEEEEVIKLQKEQAETLRDEDFGLLNDEEDDSDEEPTLGESKLQEKEEPL